jgi:hypothetical protein
MEKEWGRRVTRPTIDQYSPEMQAHIAKQLNGQVKRGAITESDVARMAELPKSKPRKYHNIPCHVNGIYFDSKREAARYEELLLLQKSGAISGLEADKKQLHFDLKVQDQHGLFVKITRYTPDFRYIENGELVIEDVKCSASKTQVYELRKKLVKALLGIEIKETM